MTVVHHLRSLLVLAPAAALSVALLAVPAAGSADQPDEKAPAAPPADAQPAAAGAVTDAGAKPDPAPAPKTATVSPEAKKVIDEVDAAYGKLKTLELAGTFSGDIQAGGE